MIDWLKTVVEQDSIQPLHENRLLLLLLLLLWLSSSSSFLAPQPVSNMDALELLLPCAVCRGRQSFIISSASWRSGPRFSRPASSFCPSRFSSRKSVDFSATSVRARPRWKYPANSCCRRWTLIKVELILQSFEAGKLANVCFRIKNAPSQC